MDLKRLENKQKKQLGSTVFRNNIKSYIKSKILFIIISSTFMCYTKINTVK